MPNDTAQQRVIGLALRDAGVEALDVGYLEAHGTGTSLGDPIEVGAAAAALGAGRDASRPLLLGSVKANIGHLEAAAGMAGLIKVVLSLRAGELPGQAHFREPNPKIAWSELPVSVVRERRPWPAGRRIAGVSGFGFSGTNAHVVVEAYEEAAAGAAKDRPAEVLVLSAKSAGALRALAGRYEAQLAGSAAASLGDLCFTAGVGRSHFEHRAAIVAGTAAELSAGLAAVRSEEAGPSVHLGHRRSRPRVGLLFTGQGSQWAGMGQALYGAEAAFREVVDRCCAAADGVQVLSRPLREVLLAAPGTAAAALLDDTAYTQPALYALQTGLWALWRSWGLEASAALGHSVGEFAAAHAAGVLSLEDGARLVTRRGALMSALPAGGAMAAVFAPAEAVSAAIGRVNAAAAGVGLSLAAENGSHRVVSGPADLVEALIGAMTAAGARCQRLTVSHAFHSGLLDPMLEALEAAASEAEPREASLALVSNLTGAAFGPGTWPDAAYWRRHARAPVRFADGVAALAGLGVDVLVELGPRPVLGPLALGCWPGAGAPAFAPSLRPGVEDERALTEAVAALYAAGCAIDFEARDAGRGRRRLGLPGYPFERTRHWVEAPKRRGRTAGHPLLGVEHRSASGETSWTQEISATDPGWLADHTVFGGVVAPGALHACLAAASAAASGPAPVAVRDGTIHAPLVLTDAPVEVQLLLSAAEERGEKGWRVFARPAGPGDAPWRLHASGRVGPAGAPPEEPPLAASGLVERDVGAFYARIASVGIVYGPSFERIERIWGGPGTGRGEIAAPEGVETGGGLHPTVLDACFQVLMAALPEESLAAGSPYVPLGWEALELWGPAPSRVICEAKLREASGDAAVLDFWLRDGTGAAFGRVRGLLLKRATRQAMLGAASGVGELLYETAWREVAAPAATAAFLASPLEAAAHGEARLAALAAGTGFEAAREARIDAGLERLAWTYAVDALSDLGWSPSAGETVEAAALRAKLGVLPEHERLFGRMLGMLGEAGVLAAAGAPGVWRATGRELAAASGEALDFDGSIEGTLLSRCGPALASVLRGETAPLRLLFPEQGVGAGDLYRGAPAFRLANAALAEAVGRATAGLPPGRRLRILEVGAGTGGTTGSILPLLPRDRTDYVFTDVSAGFFGAAEERFAACPFVSYRVLDIERDPLEQGFAAGSYDLVVASNVLHATRDVTASARRCRSLLAPGGELVLFEVLAGRAWHDLTFGLLEGWWRFADAPLRVAHPLMDGAGWERALAAAGFAETAILRPLGSEGAGVILSRAPLREPPGLWLLAADAGGVAERLAADLAGRGQRVVLARPGAALSREGGREGEEASGIERWRLRPGEASDWRALLAALPAEPALRGVAHLAGLDAAPAGETSTERLAADAEAAVGSALALAQALIGHSAAPTGGVWLVTEGAQIVAGEPGGRLAGALLWGMGRTLAHEHPELSVRRLDLEAGTAPSALLDELLGPDGEDETAWRGTIRLAPRLVRAGSEPDRLTLPEEAGWRLAKGSERTLSGLRVERTAVLPPGPGEAQVAVEAAGLNFRDVLDTLGLVPVDAGPLGIEFVGRVRAVGAGVTEFAPGDRVIGLGSGAFGDLVTAPASLLAPCPAGLAPAAAATLPSVFVTAALAFELAGLRRGERVLIHAGAGGVGLAAIQLARAIGAEPFVTASAGKRDTLRGLGLAHVYDSRSTRFAAEILAATGGRGVDVVLNSLTGEGFIAASLTATAPGGRFVEIAKRDIWSAEAMAAARPDVAYHVLAVDRLMAEAPERVGLELRRAVDRAASGELQALPFVSYPMGEARLAMRLMQQGRHIGKIVLTAPARGTVRAGATYLITGGLGGIGLAVADWLADRGATHIALNGRRAPDAKALAAVAALRGRGVTVELVQADVSRAPEVERLLGEIRAKMPPLRGVIHSVGLLRDGAVANQDWSRFADVLGPKVLGGWALHRATGDEALDFFVLFASTAGVLGARGQANHAAANVFLDQLARRRRALGLPGLSLDWGAWSEIGEAAERRPALEASMAAAGIGWMAPAQGLAALDRALAGEAAQLAVVAADWSRVAPSPLTGELRAPGRAATSPAARPAPAVPIAQRLARAPAAQRNADLVAWLGEALQNVLRLPEAPEPSAGFSSLGMDSLMAVELRNRLNAQLRLDPPLPATLLFDNPNLESLARTIESPPRHPYRNADRTHRSRRTQTNPNPTRRGRSAGRRNRRNGVPLPARPGHRRLLAPARRGDRRRRADSARATRGDRRRRNGGRMGGADRRPRRFRPRAFRHFGGGSALHRPAAPAAAGGDLARAGECRHSADQPRRRPDGRVRRHRRGGLCGQIRERP